MCATSGMSGIFARTRLVKHHNIETCYDLGVARNNVAEPATLDLVGGGVTGLGFLTNTSSEGYFPYRASSHPLLDGVLALHQGIPVGILCALRLRETVLSGAGTQGSATRQPGAAEACQLQSASKFFTYSPAAMPSSLINLNPRANCRDF